CDLTEFRKLVVNHGRLDRSYFGAGSGRHAGPHRLGDSLLGIEDQVVPQGRATNPSSGSFRAGCIYMSIPSFKVIGVRVSAATIETLHAAIDSSVKARRRFLMVSQNLHSVYLQRNNEELRRLHELADVVRIDGMPLLWFSKLDSLPVTRENRIGWM